MGFFRRRAPPDGVSAGLVARVRVLARLGPDDAASVSEIACGHAACGGVETVILLMRPGRRTEAFKIAKPLATVTDADIEAALAPAMPAATGLASSA